MTYKRHTVFGSVWENVCQNIKEKRYLLRPCESIVVKCEPLWLRLLSVSSSVSINLPHGSYKTPTDPTKPPRFDSSETELTKTTVFSQRRTSPRSKSWRDCTLYLRHVTPYWFVNTAAGDNWETRSFVRRGKYDFQNRQHDSVTTPYTKRHRYRPPVCGTDPRAIVLYLQLQDKILVSDVLSPLWWGRHGSGATNLWRQI